MIDQGSWRRRIFSAAIAMSSPFCGAPALTTAADNTAPITIPIVERLPPVIADGSGGSTLLMGRAFAQSIDDVGEEVPANGTQSVAWSAIEAAQSTLSQDFYGGADYLLVRPHLSEPSAFLFGARDRTARSTRRRIRSTSIINPRRAFFWAIGRRSPAAACSSPTGTSRKMPSATSPPTDRTQAFSPTSIPFGC